MVVSNRNLLFQGSIFKGYVSFREGKLPAIFACIFDPRPKRVPPKKSGKSKLCTLSKRRDQKSSHKQTPMTDPCMYGIFTYHEGLIVMGFHVTGNNNRPMDHLSTWMVDSYGFSCRPGNIPFVPWIRNGTWHCSKIGAWNTISGHVCWMESVKLWGCFH